MSPIHRRNFIRHSLLGGVGVVLGARLEAAAISPPSAAPPPFELEEATVAALQEGMASGKYTARALADAYLARIAAMDKAGPALNSVIELNPDALDIARALDERAPRQGAARAAARHPGADQGQHRHRRPHGHHGRLAGAGRLRRPRGTPFVARGCAQAGAVILGKTNLSEWANFRSTARPAAGAAAAGRRSNPYVLDRNPCGSSSGSGAAVVRQPRARWPWAPKPTARSSAPRRSAAWSGSSRPSAWSAAPASSRSRAARTRPGPMARTVPTPPSCWARWPGPTRATRPPRRRRAGRTPTTPASWIRRAARGARIGVVRKLVRLQRARRRLDRRGARRHEAAGAMIVDPVDIPDARRVRRRRNSRCCCTSSRRASTRTSPARGAGARCRTLEELIAFNEQHRDREMPYFGQDVFDQGEGAGRSPSQAYREGR